MRDAAQIVLDCRVLADDAAVSSWLQQPHTRRLDKPTGGMACQSRSTHYERVPVRSSRVQSLR